MPASCERDGPITLLFDQPAIISRRLTTSPERAKAEGNALPGSFEIAGGPWDRQPDRAA